MSLYVKAPLLLLIALMIPWVQAEDAPAPENASSPLAKVRNTDLKVRYLDTGIGDRNDYAIEGALMLSPKLKLRYETRYWETDVTGRDTTGMESLRLKGIYFPGGGKLGSTPYRLALGAEVKTHFDNQDKGIGVDADTLVPFIGAAFQLESGTNVIPLVQHEVEFSGEEVSVTSFRLLAVKPLANNTWLKLDAMASIDWENNDETPVSAELQYGRQFTPKFGIYAELLAGFGGYKPYEWGVGIGVRFNY